MITNVDVYFAIAEEAQAESDRLEKLARRPNPDSEGGVIITLDPERKSFKNSLVTIAFASMFLESCFYIAGVKRFGKEDYNNNHDRKTYEQKLQLFGLCDPELLAEAERFRKIRKDLVHEKAIEISDLTADAHYKAQEEAKKAISFVKQVAESLACKLKAQETVKPAM